MIASDRSRNSLFRSFGGAALLVCGVGSAAHAQTFTNIIDPLNPTFTQALGINDANEIAGYGNATIFNGFTLTLPPVAANFARLNVPGADGGTQVIGISNGASPTTVGFSITGGVTNGFANTGGQGGTFTTVDDPGFAFTQLLGINGSGTTAAGYWTHDATGATGQLAGIVTGGPGFTSPTFMGINSLLPANVNSQATGVNDGGWVVGFYQPTSTTFTGFLDKSGVISSITFPGSVSTQALGVNDLGEIVGDYTLADGNMFGFLDKGGAFTHPGPVRQHGRDSQRDQRRGRYRRLLRSGRRQHDRLRDNNSRAFDLGDDAPWLRGVWSPLLSQGTHGDAGGLSFFKALTVVGGRASGPLFSRPSWTDAPAPTAAGFVRASRRALAESETSARSLSAAFWA